MSVLFPMLQTVRIFARKQIFLRRNGQIVSQRRGVAERDLLGLRVKTALGFCDSVVNPNGEALEPRLRERGFVAFDQCAEIQQR